MKDTQARIKEYQQMLPSLRAKVSSIAILFLMSTVMMVSVSFAWVTLSTSPEVKGISTTVTANGNLEIALSDLDGKEPEESLVGDSVKELILRNITWGNLVNLSDASYGLGKITLRPAALNSSALTNSPLFAASYTKDGRVDSLTSEFAYANYDLATKEFMVPASTQYGVRAISSVTYTFAGGQEVFVERLQAASTALALAKNEYQLVTGNQDNMTAISKMMGEYLSEKFGSSTVDYQKYVPQIYTMIEGLNSCLDAAGNAMVYIANLQLMFSQGGSATFYTFETLMQTTSDELKEQGVVIEGFDTYVSDYKKFQTHRSNFKKIYDDVQENGTAVPWSKLSAIVNFIVDINSTEVNGMAVADIGMSEAATLLFQSPHYGVIYKGLLFNIEKLLGQKMYAEQLPIDVTYKGMDLTLHADIYTAAETPFYLPDAIEAVKNSNSGSFTGTDPVAAETYGMAIDLWVRTNAVEDYLILEGDVLTEQVQKEDTQGNLYYTNSETEEVVIKATDGKFYDESGKELTDITEADLTVTYMTIVSGYEGENRIWESTLLNGNSTTQGAGSCYIFYSDTPHAQAQSLEALAAMTVVFIDETGKLLAYADMDVDSHYAESGRVTVPLKLRSNSINVGEDEAGEPIYAITELEQGVAKRITALIYVDGTKLENEDVLADADIQGQLNIQFGVASELEALIDEGIYYDEILISGSATPNEFDFEEVSSVEELKTEVTLNISGATPETVTANFIRQINETQGTRQETITFIDNGDGTYTAEAQFTSPGNYVLRTVWVDGIGYDLEVPIEVTISGFSIGSVIWKYPNNYASVLSADSGITENISVTFGGSLQPGKVQGIFANENNQQVTVSFRKGTTSWSGNAKFSTSGTYTLEYLIIDGEYYEIPTNMKKILNLSLGMEAKITIPNNSFEFDGTEVTLPVYATISDNTGTELNGLENVSVQYLSQSSSMVENGLYSVLTWNETTSRYEGNFTISTAGAYEFAYMTIGNGSINSAISPVITAIPPTPPAYYSNLTEENIFAYGADVNMRVALSDSNAIANGNVIARIEKLDRSGNVEATIEVGGTSKTHIFEVGEDSSVNVTDWLFEIPTTEELNTMGHMSVSQLGTWRMTTLEIIGAYEDGSISTAEDPMIIDLTDENIITLIDDEMTVVVSGEGQELDSTLFLESGEVTEGLIVQIRGAGGEFIAYEEDQSGKGNIEVSATYAWDADSVTYSTGTTSAGYSIDDGVKASMESIGVITTNLCVDTSDTTKFILDADTPMVLPFEGTYELQSVTFKIDGTTYTASVIDGEGIVPFSADSKAPSYTYEWEAPVVKVTGINPANSKANTANDGDMNAMIYQKVVISNKINSKSNDYSVTVYFDTTTKEVGIFKKYTTVDHYTLPIVTTTLSNISSFDSASMVVVATGSSDITVDGKSSNVTFNYTSSKLECPMTIGGVGEYINTHRKVLGNGAKGTHITISGKPSILNGNTITYIFELNTPITINNPY